MITALKIILLTQSTLITIFGQAIVAMLIFAVFSSLTGVEIPTWALYCAIAATAVGSLIYKAWKFHAFMLRASRQAESFQRHRRQEPAPDRQEPAP